MKNLPIIIAVVSMSIALFAVGVALSPKQQITTMDPIIANSNGTAVTPTKKTSFVSKLTGVINVATLYESKEAYAGKKKTYGVKSKLILCMANNLVQPLSQAAKHSQA